jgi:protein gp37
MGDTNIQWADKAWNPVTGCAPISAGCQNCYAKRMANRLRGRYGYPINDPFRVTLHPEKLEEPLHWRKPERIFVNSMSDLFHEDVPDEFISDIWDVMWAAKQHIFLILTKRPERMLAWVTENAYRKQFGWTDEERVPFKPGDLIHIDDLWMRNMCGWTSSGECDCNGGYICDYPADEQSIQCEHGNRLCMSENCPIANDNPSKEVLEANGLKGQYEIDDDGYSIDCEWMQLHTRPKNAYADNVWLGVTAENQEMADKRIPILLQIPATVHFVSAEPMLGPIKISNYLGTVHEDECGIENKDQRYLFHDPWVKGIDWIIAGPETGPGARYMNPLWLEYLESQCVIADVPFFDKKNILGLNQQQFPEVSA